MDRVFFLSWPNDETVRSTLTPIKGKLTLVWSLAFYKKLRDEVEHRPISEDGIGRWGDPASQAVKNKHMEGKGRNPWEMQLCNVCGFVCVRKLSQYRCWRRSDILERCDTFKLDQSDNLIKNNFYNYLQVRAKKYGRAQKKIKICIKQLFNRKKTVLFISDLFFVCYKTNSLSLKKNIYFFVDFVIVPLFLHTNIQIE